MIGIHYWRANLEASAQSAPHGWTPEMATESAFTGTSGNDTLTGTSSADTFDVSQGGRDSVNGAGSDDIISYGKTLTGGDRTDGGFGFDTIEIQGDATQPSGYAVIFKADSLTSIELLQLNTGIGFSHYTIALNNANVAAGDTLTVAVDGPTVTQDIFLDADFETDGHVNFTGGGGDDAMIIGPNLQTTDRLDGGAGQNFLTIHGDYSGGLVLNATTILNFFEIDFGPGFSYDLTLNDATCAAGQILHISAAELNVGQSLVLDASADTDGRLFIVGGEGNDSVILGSPTTQTTQVDFGAGGDDTATGGEGADVFVMWAALTAADRIDGGTGTGFDDILDLNGNYAAGITFDALTVVNVETILLHLGFSYKLTLDDGNVAAGDTLLVDGSALGASHVLTFHDAAETSATLHVIGGAGNDVITTGDGSDELSLDRGGNDTANGGNGDDLFDMQSALNATDAINGGNGSDVLLLTGDYGAGVTFSVTTMINVETIAVAAGFNYKLTLNDGNVAAGDTLLVDGSALSSSRILTFSGAGELDGTYDILGGAGADVLTGGHLDDTLNGGSGNDTLNGGAGNDTVIAGLGIDTVSGGPGDDTFVFGTNLTASDTMAGDSGFDTLLLEGDYTIVFGAAALTSVENVELTAGHSYDLTFNNANVAAAARLTVDGGGVDGAHAVSLDGSGETDGRFTFTGGAGDDELSGGALADILTGGGGDDIIGGGAGGDTLRGAGGADIITGGTGADTYLYNAAGESTGPNHDTLIGFDANGDVFDLTSAVTGIDAEIIGGKLNSAKFNNGMQKMVRAADLAPNHAVLATPDTGDLAGQVFLVVDLNGVAGYQNNADLVIHLDAGVNLGGLDVSDFI